MISIITCSANPLRYARFRDHLASLLKGEPHEFIPINDAASMAEGYNRGVRSSQGSIIICCHEDIEILNPDFTSLLISRLKRFDLLGIAGSSRLCGSTWFDAGMPYLFGQLAYPPKDHAAYDVVQWSTPAAVIGSIKVIDGVFMAGRREVFEKTPFDQKCSTDFISTMSISVFAPVPADIASACVRISRSSTIPAATMTQLGRLTQIGL